MQLLLFLLVLLAGLSPLLTFARLFQLKEWRWDRLREHLRHEGCCSQLFGWVRPTVIASGLLFYGVFSFFPDVLAFDPLYFLWGAIGMLAWFTLFRFVVGKQARPVWTSKSIAVSVLAVALYFVVAWLLTRGEQSPAQAIIFSLLPLLSFSAVIFAVVLLSPLDRFLKNRILNKARKVRASLPNLTVIGITGSVGKTMTKELLAHILSDRKALVTPAHVNTELGVANLMIAKLKEDHQLFIVEMGAYRRGEIKLLCSLTAPQIGIITYIGKQHLGLFGSQEDLCHAKGELFAALPPSGHAYLNADTEYCEHLMKLASCPVQTVGTGGHATFEAFDIQETGNGVMFTLRGESFAVPLQGTHQVTNVLLAAAAAETLGVLIVESAKRLRTFTNPPQTFEKKEGEKGQIVLDDTHNASPASFRAAIEWARAHDAKTKILVTAGLLELGKEECVIHKELGALSREVFDDTVFLSNKCVRDFEQGYGKQVKVAPKKKFKIAVNKDMLIVCEGRMPETIVQSLLS